MPGIRFEELEGKMVPEEVLDFINVEFPSYWKTELEKISGRELSNLEVNIITFVLATKGLLSIGKRNGFGELLELINVVKNVSE